MTLGKPLSLTAPRGEVLLWNKEVPRDEGPTSVIPPQPQAGMEIQGHFHTREVT